MTNRTWLTALFLATCTGGCGSDDSGSASAGGGGGHGSVTSLGGGAGAGSGGGAGDESCPRFVKTAPSHQFGPGQSAGQLQFPSPILGPPRGGGSTQGSLDVVALGNGGQVTLAFGPTRIADGAGPDFIVFENAFFAAGDPKAVFAELATVEVSGDGQSWTAFPCTASAAPYGACAGWHPVYANADDNEIDPLDPAVAGGDAYDLADIGVLEAGFVRITDRPDLEGMSGIFDLDAVGIVNAACP